MARAGVGMAEEGGRVMGKLKTGSKAWKESLIDTLLCYAPPLAECRKCGRVIHADYVCPCGHDNSGDEQEVRAEEWL